MTETSEAAASSCPNCDSPMPADQNFCGDCGQRRLHGRLKLHDIGHDLLHAITHADHSVLSLVRDLALRPGRVAREYVEGRRKKYFGPFAFLFIAVGLASFAILLAGVQWFAPIDNHPVASFLQNHVNLVILMQAPILTGLCRLLFPGPRRNFAEILVLVAYASGMRCLVLGLVATPLMHYTGGVLSSRALLTSYYLVWVIYFSCAAVQFFDGRAWLSACKAALAAILTQLSTVYVIFAFIWVWARFVH